MAQDQKIQRMNPLVPQAGGPPPLPNAPGAQGPGSGPAGMAAPPQLPANPSQLPPPLQVHVQAQAQMQAQLAKTPVSTAKLPAHVAWPVSQQPSPIPTTAAPTPTQLPSQPPLLQPGQPADADTSERRAARRKPSGPARGRVAANDDGPSIGGLIYALNQKPSTKPFQVAALSSGIWLALCIGFAWVLLAPDFSNGNVVDALVGALGRPGILTAAATLMGPVGLFWFLALLAWRAEELRLRATTMTEVAVRLAEPDRMAEQSVASLGQAVRRQVSFMNDAVSRALGRAGELEALVHNEVTALERSYQENERKIRGLIQELAGERGALVNTGDRVAETLRGLGAEVPALIEKLSNQQIKLAKIIEGAGQNLTALETAIATQTGNLETQIGSKTDHLQKVLESYTATLGNTLGARSTEMQTLFDGYMESIDSTIGNRTETLQVVFEEYARALDTTLANRAQALDIQLVERTKALDDAFSHRLQLFDESMLRSTAAIDSAVTSKAELLAQSIETHATAIGQTIGTKTDALQESLGRHTEMLGGTLGRHNEILDGTLNSHTQLISETVGNHAKSIGDTLGRQAVQFDESLMHGINAVRRSSESITKQSIKAIEGLAGQSDLLKNVSENLLTQINSVTNRFENQGQSIMRAANALETANYKIDSTLQKRQVELGSTLERMTEKAEDLGKFMQGYQSSLEGSITQAEARARQLTDDFTRNAEERQRQTLADLERLKLAANIEADRTAEDMRNRVSHVSQEVSQKLGSLTNQFTESSAEMRLRTAEAAAQLAEEQARMRAQTEQLPLAARDSADAMRNALKDQLRAMDQLSSLASREQQRRDVALPAETFTPPQIAAQPAARTLTSLSSTLAQEMTSRRVSPAQLAGTGAAPQPQQFAPLGQSAPVPAAAASGAANSWKFGDLLARASHEQDDHGVAAHKAANAAAIAAVQPVGSSQLNIEAIARALDPATATAIWSRFQSGQRGIMVRSIYTAEGREAFDDAVRLYRSEAEFQRSVDRFLADFERNLRETEQADPTGRSVQAQFGSEAGRIYLLLAHASGRLA
jgi:hypothetical protein